MDNFMVYKGPSDNNKKTALMLHLAGDKVLHIYQTLKHANDSYEDVKNKLTNYFKPKHNRSNAICKFRQLYQFDEESIDAYTIRLRDLARFCDFHNEDDEIKLQIIQNCNSIQLKRQLLKLDDPTLVDDSK